MRGRLRPGGAESVRLTPAQLPVNAIDATRAEIDSQPDPRIAIGVLRRALHTPKIGDMCG